MATVSVTFLLEEDARMNKVAFWIFVRDRIQHEVLPSVRFFKREIEIRQSRLTKVCWDHGEDDDTFVDDCSCDRVCCRIHGAQGASFAYLSLYCQQPKSLSWCFAPDWSRSGGWIQSSLCWRSSQWFGHAHRSRTTGALIGISCLCPPFSTLCRILQHHLLLYWICS